MELGCQNEGCDSEFFTPDKGKTIFSVDGEIISYPDRGDNTEPWISEVYVDYIIVEWIPRVEDEEEDIAGGIEVEVIPIEDFHCLACDRGVVFRV